MFSYPRDLHPEDSKADHVCINSESPSSNSIDRDPKGEEDAFIFCPPKLWAFSLKFKSWALIAHDDLGDVRRDSSFEDELYMDDKTKKPLDQIVNAYMNDGKFRGNDETLGQKGRGLNILLVGSSGTGKTFTAGKYPSPPSILT